MCESCGCGEFPEKNDHADHHNHHDPSDHKHLPDGRVISVRRDILGENNLVAERNRGFLEAKETICFNMVGSPGSGKTTLLERTCNDLGIQYACYVIEGDQQSSLDADRIVKTGVKAIQINTEYGCHLDARMVSTALKELAIQTKGIVFIENIGNLVCPAMFDLGETKRVVIYSVAEGNDKPLKYPYMFRSANLVIITKTDLMPYVDFNMVKAREDILKTNPGISVIELSVKSGEGLDDWYRWMQGAGTRILDV